MFTDLSFNSLHAPMKKTCLKLTLPMKNLTLPMTKRLLNLSPLAAIALAALFATHSVSADTTTSEWTGFTSGTWSTITNWTPNTIPSTTVSALFDSSFSNQPQLGASQNTQGIWLKTGLGQDVTISATSSRTLTITGNATLSGQANAGIIMDDSSNHNFTVGTNTSLSVSNDTGFYVNNSGTLTISSLNPNGHAVTLGGTNSSGSIVISAFSSGASVGSLIVNTSGTVSFAGSNTGFTGGVTLNAGVLNVNSSRALGASTSVLTLNGGTLDSANGTSVLNVNPVTFGGNFTFGGTSNLSLAAAPITNAGDRTITLNGSAKTLTFSGTMTNSKGASQTTTVNGAGNILSLGGYALSNSGVDYNNVINGTGNVTITGVVSNGVGGSTASGLTYSGSGLLSLGGANTFGSVGGAGLTVRSGTVQSTNNAGFGVGTVTLGDATTNASATLVGFITTGTITNPLILASGVTAGLTIGSSNTGNSLLTFTGGVTGVNNVLLAATPASAGGVTFSTAPINNGGTVTNVTAGSGLVTINGGVGSNVTGVIQSATNSGLTISGSPLTVNSGTTTLTNNSPAGSSSSKNLTVSSSVDGTGNLVLNNNNSTVTSGGITLSGTVNHIGTITSSGNGTGSTLISGGVGSNVTTITQSSTTSALTIQTNAIAVNSNATTLANNSAGGSSLFTVTSGVIGTGNLVLNNNGVVSNGITIATTALSFSGTLINSGVGSGGNLISAALGSGISNVTQNSATSSLTLSGINTNFNGSVTLTSGTLLLSGSQSLGGNGSVTGVGGALNIAAGTTLDGALIATNISTVNAETWNGDFTLGGGATFGLGTGAITLGAANVKVSNASSANKTTTIGGTVTGVSNLTVAANGNCDYVFSGLVNNVGTITNSGTGTDGNTFSGGVGANVTAITENSASSALSITTNALAVNSGTTALINSNGSGSALLTLSGGVANTSGNLVLNNNSAIVNGITLSTNAINNIGTITNSGTGTGGTLISASIGGGVTGVNQNSSTSSLTLSSTNNTYTGPTTVSAGTLIISGSIAGSTNVQSGGTISGAGAIGGPLVTLSTGVGSANNGHIAPGAVGAAGVLTINNTTDLANNSFLDFNLNTPGTAAGVSGNDLLKIQGTSGANGDLTIGSDITLTIATGGGFGVGTYHLITYTGSLFDNSSSFSGWSVSGLLAGEAASFSIGSNSIDLQVIAVPEPGTWAMLLGGIGMLGFWQRSRRLRA